VKRDSRESYQKVGGRQAMGSRRRCPSLVGVIRDWSGAYGAALGACTALQAIAAILILLGPGGQRHDEPAT
jgi:hypothetical protein